MMENIYYRFGKPYRKLKRNEVIEEGSMTCWCHGELQQNVFDETIGDVPANYSIERDFFNPIKKE